mmetsp:Transcript_24545/g.85320  ORF Transcript_24545/g.85320 Transcript_24545/m.85320 type:complete len:222 (-) Transcript_24545:809-1474(-)
MELGARHDAVAIRDVEIRQQGCARLVLAHLARRDVGVGRGVVRRRDVLDGDLAVARLVEAAEGLVDKRLALIAHLARQRHLQLTQRQLAAAVAVEQRHHLHHLLRRQRDAHVRQPGLQLRRAELAVAAGVHALQQPRERAHAVVAAALDDLRAHDVRHLASRQLRARGRHHARLAAARLAADVVDGLGVRARRVRQLGRERRRPRERVRARRRGRGEHALA